MALTVFQCARCCAGMASIRSGHRPWPGCTPAPPVLCAVALRGPRCCLRSLLRTANIGIHVHLPFGREQFHLGASNTAAQPTAQPNSTPARLAVEALDFTKVAACTKELQMHWIPSKVESVVMADETTLALRLRAVDRSGWLYLSWHPVAARVCIGDEPERGEASEAFPVAKLANSKLRGQVLIGASMPVPFDRITQLDFAFRPGEPPELSAMCEVQGRYSNVILTDADSSILLAAHQVGGQQSSMRQVHTGSRYTFPPMQAGVPPSADEGAESWRTNIVGRAEIAGGDAAAAVVSGLTRAYLGVSTSLARELCRRAGIQEDATVSGLGEEEWQALFAIWQEWLARLAEGQFEASRDAESGRISVLGTYAERTDSVHALLDLAYRTAQGAERFAALRATVNRAVSVAGKKLRSKLASFEKQLSSSEAADATQKRADLIMANVYCWPAGAASLEVEDWDTGEKVTLTLDDATLGPVESARAIYKRAAKQRRAADQLLPLMEEARAQLEYIDEIAESLHSLDRFEEIQDLRALQEVQDELVEAKLMKPPADQELAAKGRAKAQKAAKKRGTGAPGGDNSKFRVFTAPSGLQVLVGRNNRQNDELSCRVANDNDVWMHARGVPGSHLIIRIPPGADATDDDIQFGADLCTYYSKARESGRCDVVVTEAGQLKKPKGAKPGQVLVLKERVTTGFPDNCAAARNSRD